jgi:hypothetical protein
MIFKILYSDKVQTISTFRTYDQLEVYASGDLLEAQ